MVLGGKLHLIATKPWFFHENGTLLQQNHGFSWIWEENGTLLQQKHGFSRKMAPCCNKTMVFQGRPSLTSPVPDQDPGRPKTLKTRVFHLNGDALSRPWMPEKHKNHELWLKPRRLNRDPGCPKNTLNLKP